MNDKTKLASGNDLPDYTWDRFTDDLHTAGLFNSHWHDIDSAIAKNAAERMVYARARRTSAAVDRYIADERARFALNVNSLRHTPYGHVTPNDILDRPRHWLVAYAIAEKLAGRA